MRQFLAVLWRAQNEPAIVAAALRNAERARMVSTVRDHGMLLVSRDLETCTFQITPSARAAALLGNVHYRYGPNHAFDGSAAEIERLAQICRNGELAEKCWGSFLAFQSRCADGPVEVHHSPFSSLSAYYAEAQGALLLASDAVLLAGLTEEKPSVDWRSVASQLGFDNLSLKCTCLAGVRELRCGEALHWNADGPPISTRIWDPWQFTARSQFVDDYEVAIKLLERELTRCVSTRTHGLNSPLLDLSGGLDSSIIAALCAKNTLEVRAVNVFSAQTEGDERAFARATAEHLHVDLAELSPQAERIDVRHCPSPHLPRPHARSFVQEIDRLTLSAAPSATAFLNGGGGDAVFCHLQSSGPAADVLRSPGSGAGFFKTVNAVAAAAQCSFWTALRMAVAKAVPNRATIKLVENATFLSRDARIQPASDELPWPPPPKGVLPGKLEHVRGIYTSCFNMHGFARSLRLKAVFPLLSQPLVELCLRIPTWMWLGRGHDRYLLRKIADKWLPPQVAWRRSKGGLGQLQRDLYRLNRGVIREMLLDGALQKQGLLERAQLEAHLGPASTLTSDQFPRLLRLCDFEAWAAHWT